MPAADAEEDLSLVEPDELFVRFTVGQVKALATKLRADADAKQEELRLMVGERYRDLLQASTSIIDMAASSQKVVDTLQEMRQTCSEQNISKVPVVSRTATETDVQLKTLQSLAAHMKLLLDCPEQFWKLLESKQYLDAAWLFLVARVVHHSLVSEEEEGVWTDHGIDVLEQFPLVQRQWDAINGFRAQISHKAIQSLREEMTTEETTYAAISLFLLDSMSLVDTLGVFLSQRTKAVQAFLSASKTSSTNVKGRVVISEPNGVTSKPGRKKTLRETKKILCEAISVLVGTVHAARSIYSAEAAKPSPIESILTKIQTDTQNSVISTAKILGKLPSASLLDLYLPPSIKSYAPYIDTTGTSARLTGATVSSKLEKWFASNLANLSVQLDNWVGVLNNARDVDDIRSTALATGSLRHLSNEEQAMMTACVEEACSKRIVQLWGLAFQALHEEFAASLSKSLDLIRNSEPSSKSDLDPSGSLLASNLPFPPSARGSHSQVMTDTAFSTFDATLRHRRSNRTPLLDAVISGVENKLKKLQGELESATGGRFAKEILLTRFGPLEDQLGTSLVKCLESELETVSKTQDEVAIDLVVFIGRVSASLATSPLFVEDRLGSGKAVKEFQTSASRVHSRTLTIWQSRTVSRLSKSTVSIFQPTLDDCSHDTSAMTTYTRPSPAILQALTSLSSSAYQLGLSRRQLQEKRVLRGVLEKFSEDCFQSITIENLEISTSTSQQLWDLYFLKALCRETGLQGMGDDVSKKFQYRLESLMSPKAAKAFVSNTESAVTQALPRLQLLLSLFFIDAGSITPASNASSLLPRGVPAAESSPAPTLVLAKPPSRFGLLLVPGSARTTLR